MMMKSFLTCFVFTACMLHLLPTISAFSPSSAKRASLARTASFTFQPTAPIATTTQLYERISDKRRKQLGIGKGEDEYDLDVALNTNTDPLISKIIAGSFILVMIALLVVGVIIPYTTDYGEGVCNPILTQGRC